MVIKFGSNILSLNLQRELGRTTTDLSTVFERLSSGQRINRASDDAAGLSISSILRADTRVLNQGVRNLNDGLSATNIAEAALSTLSSVAERIQELATQASNSSLADKQRKGLQREVTALQAEWNRIVESTTFNGMNLLMGSSSRMTLQGGRGSDAMLTVQIGSSISGATTRVSASASGVEGNDTSAVRAISADGRYVAFDSLSTNLVSGDTNTQRDAFIKDTLTGVVTRVNTDSNGNQALGSASYVTSISGDGRYVTFHSSAANLVAGDTNTQIDTFVKDTLTGITIRVSTDSAGTQASGGTSRGGQISADGRYVAFFSSATNLVAGDTNGQVDSFVKDLQTGALTRISTSSSGAEALGGLSVVTSISADGRYVAFESDANNLVASDTNGNRDVFIKDTLTGTTTRISTDTNGIEAIFGGSSGALLSADGMLATFISSASNLVSGDSNGQGDVFLKDLSTGVTTRINTTSSGLQALGGTSVVQGISADGRFVVFNSSATNLVTGDTNGAQDVFLKDLLSGSTIRINVGASGQESIGTSSTTRALSADARFVAFDSAADNLVDGDGNMRDDVFLRDLTREGVQQMAGMVVSNRASASVTLSLIDKYKDELLGYRANLGAVTSRITTFRATLSATALNYATAESRITDADIAMESATAVALSIKQQVATALLAQANLSPQLGLALLGRRR